MKVKVNGKVVSERYNANQVARQVNPQPLCWNPEVAVSVEAPIRKYNFDRENRGLVNNSRHPELMLPDLIGEEQMVQLPVMLGNAPVADAKVVADITKREEGKRLIDKFKKDIPWRKVGVLILIVGGTLVLNLIPYFGNTHVAMAAEPAKAAVNTAVELGKKFDPIIEIIKSLARPFAYGSFAYAGIVYILGQREKAVAQIRGTVIGYLLVQLSPAFMNVIDSVGKLNLS